MCTYVFCKVPEATEQSFFFVRDNLNISDFHLLTVLVILYITPRINNCVDTMFHIFTRLE